MRMDHTTQDSQPAAASPADGARRYWAPCAAVALVAVSLFYVTLQDMVRESAARPPALPPTVMPAYVEPARLAATGTPPGAVALEPQAPTALSIQAPSRAEALTLTTFKPLATVAIEPPAKVAPAVVEVHKCITADGEAAYTDGPCPEGASVSTLQLPREAKAAARL